MAIADQLIPEFDHEASLTRQLLARVPEEHGEWKPHEKSYSLGQLAMHIAHLPKWAQLALKETEYDLATPDDDPGARVFDTTEGLLATFDDNIANAREGLVSTPDDEMMGTWTLKMSGEVLFSMPRVAVLRSFVMNHMIHHRGQLTVYLRLRDVPLPPTYGPTADEAPEY